MRILLLGASGRLGKEIIRVNSSFGFEMIFPNSKQVDIADEVSVSKLNSISPDLIINCAGFTNVDRAETDIELAYNTNKCGPGLLANLCKDLNIPMIHLSTDYVFSGSKKAPYNEEDLPEPVNVYGKSKYEGEQLVSNVCEKHIILRTSWIFGLEGDSFVKTILKLATQRTEVSVVVDEISCPTTSSSIAYAILQIVKQIKAGSNKWGLYHFCGAPSISRYNYALEIMEIAKSYATAKMGKIQAITSDQFPTKAKRPNYSVMNTNKIFETFSISPNNWRLDLGVIVPLLLKQL